MLFVPSIKRLRGIRNIARVACLCEYLWPAYSPPCSCCCHCCCSCVAVGAKTTAIHVPVYLFVYIISRRHFSPVNYQFRFIYIFTILLIFLSAYAPYTILLCIPYILRFALPWTPRYFCKRIMLKTINAQYDRYVADIYVICIRTWTYILFFSNYLLLTHSTPNRSCSCGFLLLISLKFRSTVVSHNFNIAWFRELADVDTFHNCNRSAKSERNE